MSAQAVESGRGDALAQGARRRAGEWLPALIVFAIGIAAWEWIFSPLAGQFLLPAAVGDLERALGQPPPALAGRLVHVQGGARRLRRRLGLGDPRRARARPLAPRRGRAPAVRDRAQRGADHRLRADHERLVRRPQPALEDGDRRDPLLLPGAREHAARPDVRAARVDRADALVRGERASRSSAACASRPRCRCSSRA